MFMHQGIFAEIVGTDTIESLRRENHNLAMANKKLTRLLDLAETQIERTRGAIQAKDSLANLISSRRSELERYMNLLLSNCPDMILLFDKDGKIAYCTESFLKMCSIPAFGLIKGTPLTNLLSPYTGMEFLEEMLQALSQIQEKEVTFEFSDVIDFNRSGNPRSYVIQVTPMLTEYGVSEGFMILFSDTTDIFKAQKDAERANAAKSEFLATISHEIRTPMNAIIGLAGMLKSTKLNDKQHNYLKSIQDSSQILLNLINDLLDFSKIEASKLELISDYFRLKIFLKDLQSMFELMFQQKNIDFVCEFSADLPEVVFGDDKRIRQILTNILNNALKYTPHGKVLFRVSQSPDGKIYFEVEDTGIGIREEAIPRIFQAFEQLDTARNKGVMGTGLGLAITKQLCLIMNGSINVTSEYNKGSCFSVSLPLPEGTEADLPSVHRKDFIPFNAPSAKVLVVDDIEINLQITAFMLESFGITSDFAQSGKQAIEKVSSTQYDMIFMDHMMPEMDGIEATRIIRSMGGDVQDIPIVALSANAVSDAVEKFFFNGMNDFLSKPIDQAALAQCLLDWLPKEKIVYFK
jgi:PAS domain S-box-containing protein